MGLPHITLVLRESMYMNLSITTGWVEADPLPPRSPDLQPLDFYRCGQMKALVFYEKQRLTQRQDSVVEFLQSHITRATATDVIASATQFLSISAEKVRSSRRKEIWTLTIMTVLTSSVPK